MTTKQGEVQNRHSNTKLCCCTWSTLRDVFTYSKGHKLQRNLTPALPSPSPTMGNKMQQIWHPVPDTSEEKNHNRQFQCARPVFKPSHRFTSTSAEPFYIKDYSSSCAEVSFFTASPNSRASLGCLSEPHTDLLPLTAPMATEETKTQAENPEKSQIAFPLNVHQDVDCTEVQNTQQNSDLSTLLTLANAL